MNVFESIDWEKVHERAAIHGRLGDEVKEKFSTPERWDAIRRMYDAHMPEIMSARKNHGIDPYFTDWVSMFTPIEAAAWSSIRWHALPMYPQFPVLNYFLDFGNPVKKIGIELDGAQWHNVEKDTKRDERLAGQGWEIYRITGREAYKKYSDIEELQHMNPDARCEALEDWMMNTADGVIAAIKVVHFGEKASRYGVDDGLCIRTLVRHQLVYL